MDDDPLFIIAPTPPRLLRPRSNRVGKHVAVATAIVGLAIGLAIGTAINHHRGTPAGSVTATPTK